MQPEGHKRLLRGKAQNSYLDPATIATIFCSKEKWVWCILETWDQA